MSKVKTNSKEFRRGGDYFLKWSKIGIYGVST